MPNCWRMSLGERGCRVVLFERKPGGTLYREVWIGGQRVAAKKSLGHRDRERAKADAYKLLATLKSNQDALSGGRLTLRTLFDIYVGSPSFQAKKPRTQREDRRKLERVVKFLGHDRDIRSLSDSDVARYTQARLEGDKVRVRTVEADLVTLRTMLNWGTRQRNAQGRPLLEYNPLRGVKLPGEKNPRRPVETYDRYIKLMEVAGEVDWRLATALTLAESTGQRISSILGLQRRDVDFDRPPYGWLHFRAEHQKNGRSHWVPVTPECREQLIAHLERVPPTPDAWLFPSKHDASRPVDVFRMSRRLRWAYERAGLETLEGGLWHPWRRKWATERKNMPLKDVAEAGGWRDPNTLLKCYQQPDEATMTRVVLEPGKLREA